MVPITEARSLTQIPSQIIYPSSDGEPLAETQQHVLAILMALALLRIYLQGQQAVVFADQFLYYIEGNPKARIAPDVMVVFNIPKRLYASYKLWEGKQIPAIIIEVTSAGTKEVDWGFKKNLYEQIGVQEYWLFDPYRDWLEGQLQAYSLNEDGVYKPIKDYCSQVLQLKLQAEEHLIGFYRLDNGEKLLTPEELYAAALQEKSRAEIERSRAENEKAVAETERARADVEKSRADRLAEKLRELGVDLS
jgi:Uma2 family endonuclease